MESEHIDDLDEAKILGYFETVHSTFLLKVACLVALTKKVNGRNRLRFSALPVDVWQSVAAMFEDPLFLTVARRGNEELLRNLQDDAVSGIVVNSWIVFEQVIKDLHRRNYAHATEEVPLDYRASIFQFDKREKKNLDFMYYLRNAIVHANGAFTAVRSTDHHYDGQHFKSKGFEGVKMILSLRTAWKISRDLERYTCKAWSNAGQQREKD